MSGPRRARLLARPFYARDALEVAPALLNKLLVMDAPGAPRVAVRIVEVEAYRGADDPASHAYKGRTARNATMFGPAGHLYVYFTYGMHWCANVVCASPGIAQGVLLRAAAPVEGLDVMRERRPKARTDRDLCRGPARLAQALGLHRAHDGLDLLRGPLRGYDDGVAPPARPGRSARIGVTAAHDHRWRWYVPGDPNVSGPANRGR